MDLKELKVERIALMLLVSFIVILFLDYSFNVVEIINHKWNININNTHKLRYLVLISIVPVIYFINKTEYDKKPDILINSLIPFLSFLLGFYMIKIDFFHTIGGIVIVMIIQLLSALSILMTLETSQTLVKSVIEKLKTNI